MVEVSVTDGTETTVLSAHEAILAKSPWFAAKCSEFPAAGPVSHARSKLAVCYHTDHFYSVALRPPLTTSWR